MKVIIKRWHAVATWRWEVNDERCGICYTAFEACCPDCNVPGDDCPPGKLQATYPSAHPHTSIVHGLTSNLGV